MISRTGRGGYEDFLDRHPEAKEFDRRAREAGWTEIIGEIVRAIQKGRDTT